MRKVIIILLVICMIAAMCAVTVCAAEVDSPQTQAPVADFGIVTVAVITALVYIIGLGIKATNLDNKWIPVICGLCGIILGILSIYIGVPDFPATDPMTAAAVGGVSGLAATGIDQIYKQLTQ